MNNTIGENVRIFRNVVMRTTKIGNSTIIADDVFVTDSDIGCHCTVERRSMIFNSIIGDYSYTGYNTVVKHAQIGKYSSISWNVSIGGANHDINRLTTHPFPFNAKYGFVAVNHPYTSFADPVCIGNDVWIGSNVCVLRGVNIGNGAVIGAGAVVTKDIPPYEIWAGVPAKKIGQRFPDDMIQQLQDLAWWDLPHSYIQANITAFQHELSAETLNKLLGEKDNLR